MSLPSTMELWELLLGGLILIVVAVVLFARVFNRSIAGWVAQMPQIVQQTAQAGLQDIKLPKFKLMDVLGYGAMEILQDPSVKKEISGAISGVLRGLGGKKGGPPVG